MKKVISYLALFVIGFIGVSVWSFWIVVRPPKFDIPGTPADYGLPAEDSVIETADGLKLSAWFIPIASGRPENRGSKGQGFAPVANTPDREYLRRENRAREHPPAVILLHGYPAEKSDLLPIAQALHPNFATLLVDLRSFGESEGRFTTLGLKERDDLKRAVDFLESRGYSEIGVFGFSLGGAVGITTAAEDPRIKAVAAYAPFADLKLLGYDAYSRLPFLKYPLVELMRLWARVFFGGDPTQPSPAKAARSLSIPALIIASREDEQIPFRHAELLQRALAENPQAEFYLLDRGRHGELPPDFEERLTEFFAQSL